MQSVILTCVVALAAIVVVQGDTPGNCMYEDIRGTWTFKIGKGGNNNTLDCSNFQGPYVEQYEITLKYYANVSDTKGNEGFWTLIYNQGFEVVIDKRKFFAFSKFVGRKSYCSETLPGWAHNIDGTNWACYVGQKSKGEKKIRYSSKGKTSREFITPEFQENFVSAINSVQNSWTARTYDEFNYKTWASLMQKTGGPVADKSGLAKAQPTTPELEDLVSDLPANFDWRNVKGQNYVSPVRDQEACGSCYAFASMGMAEARVRIQTKLSQKPIYSPQDVLECSEYAQGCGGGFSYLVAGKYAQDFGIVEEKCNPYKGRDVPTCTTDPSCERVRAKDYSYIGGFYGNCSEPAMRRAIYDRGPVAVGFEVQSDFFFYSEGIYQGTGINFNPFVVTDHAVVIVGWGEDSDGKKFWNVKNSWGADWGDHGYFKIARGNDQQGIESCACESTLIVG
ncbi:dipeptidyl peptidase 1 [Aplysia californica]|uniref:Dipeptidyl peptidase 1 n=1 Tax=Aplysia californica TaxID=6500 RepID=A0ABM1A2C7_APLCA|nr:dipeptidyl peptidase 1 [Aplysia californica]